MRRRGGFDKGFLLLLLIVLILVGTGMFLYEQIRTDKIAEDVKKGQPIVMAIFITDTGHLVDWRDIPVSQQPATPDGTPAPNDGAATEAQGAGAPASGQPVQSTVVGAVNRSGSTSVRTDGAASSNSLLFTEVLVIDPRTNGAALVDVPGNVGELIPSVRRITRIDVLFKPAAVDAYVSEIASLLGIAIPFHLTIDFQDVPKLVDLLGGLDMFIANPIDQTSGSSMVLLPSGSLLLDGAKVQSYLSYKGPADGDIEIIGRRQKFVQALLKTIQGNPNLFEKPGVYPLLKTWISTNMNKRSLLSFFGEVAHLNLERMMFQRILGVNRTVDGQELLFPHYNGRLLRETVQQTLTTLSNPQSMSEQVLNAKLQILNGTLNSGLAHRTSAVFQSFGYDVVSIGNADKQDYAKTVILDRTGDLAQAQRVAGIIRCTDIQSQPLPPPSPSAGVTTQAPPANTGAGADVTIILGKDFDGRYCK